MQARINKNEELLNTGALKSERINSDNFEETYTKSTPGNTRQMHSGEQKVLGVRWNVVADQFVNNLSDVVVVHSEERHRGFWKLARVEDTIIGRDEELSLEYMPKRIIHQYYKAPYNDFTPCTSTVILKTLRMTNRISLKL